MKEKIYLLIEFLLLFVLFPLSLTFTYPFWLKATFAISGFAYVIWVLKSTEYISFSVKQGIHWRKFWRRMLFTLILIAISTIIFVLFTSPKHLFFVPLNRPALFFFILFVYSIFSVWPQEIIFRTFFFERYERLFRKKWIMVLLNAFIFSLAHLFYKNELVLLVTFIGGIIFGLTFIKFRSTTLVSIEHAIYGNWLFTVGMGEMLDFPGMET